MVCNYVCQIWHGKAVQPLGSNMGEPGRYDKADNCCLGRGGIDLRVWNGRQDNLWQAECWSTCDSTGSYQVGLKHSLFLFEFCVGGGWGGAKTALGARGPGGGTCRADCRGQENAGAPTAAGGATR